MPLLSGALSPPPAWGSPETPYPVVLEIVRNHRGAEGPGRVNTAAGVVYLWEGRVRGNRRGDGEKETEMQEERLREGEGARQQERYRKRETERRGDRDRRDGGETGTGGEGQHRTVPRHRETNA